MIFPFSSGDVDTFSGGTDQCPLTLCYVWKNWMNFLSIHVKYTRYPTDWFAVADTGIRLIGAVTCWHKRRGKRYDRHGCNSNAFLRHPTLSNFSLLRMEKNEPSELCGCGYIVRTYAGLFFRNLIWLKEASHRHDGRWVGLVKMSVKFAFSHSLSVADSTTMYSMHR